MRPRSAAAACSALRLVQQKQELLDDSVGVFVTLTSIKMLDDFDPVSLEEAIPFMIFHCA
jgi:hypothetical protein